MYVELIFNIHLSWAFGVLLSFLLFSEGVLLRATTYVSGVHIV